MSMKSLINDTSYHDNQQEPRYPSYLIHQHLNLTRTSLTRPENTATLLSLGIPNITRTTPNLHDSVTEITRGMRQCVPLISLVVIAATS